NDPTENVAFDSTRFCIVMSGVSLRFSQTVGMFSIVVVAIADREQLASPRSYFVFSLTAKPVICKLEPTTTVDANLWTKESYIICNENCKTMYMVCRKAL
ncbi:hypothetical protein KI387_000932, partial [Taxus chinensis]